MRVIICYIVRGSCIKLDGLRLWTVQREKTLRSKEMMVDGFRGSKLDGPKGWNWTVQRNETGRFEGVKFRATVHFQLFWRSTLDLQFFKFWGLSGFPEIMFICRVYELVHLNFFDHQSILWLCQFKCFDRCFNFEQGQNHILDYIQS